MRAASLLRRLGHGVQIGAVFRHRRRREIDEAVEEAALLIAAHLRTDLDVDAQLVRIDQIASGCDASLDSILTHLFDDLAYRGNVSRYYDPANSCLDHVMDSGSGIPITLSVLLMAVARRHGRTMEGIGMPGHFLVRDVQTGVYIDAFDHGRRLDGDGCCDLYQRIGGDPRHWDQSFLEPVGAVAIVRRMLNNLISIGLREHDRATVAIASRLRADLPDASVAERAEFATALALSGEPTRAAGVLEALAAEAPSEEAEALLTAAARFRASLN